MKNAGLLLLLLLFLAKATSAQTQPVFAGSPVPARAIELHSPDPGNETLASAFERPQSMRLPANLYYMEKSYQCAAMPIAPGTPVMELPVGNIVRTLSGTKTPGKTSGCRAIGGLVMLLNSVRYFATTLRTRAGIQLCCQKTRCGSSLKAYKKVTGVTFALPIGR